MAVLGLLGTGMFAADERPQNWREVTLLEFPNGAAPLTAMTSQMLSEDVDDYTYNWWEKVADMGFYFVNDATIANDETETTIKIDDGNGNDRDDRIRNRDIIWVPRTGERMIATANGVAGTGVVVTRDWHNDGTYGILDDDELINLGPAYEEGAAIGSGLQVRPTKRTNYTQIFRHPIEQTRSARRTRLRSGSAIAEAKREALMWHTLAIEKSFLLGKARDTTLNGQRQSTTDGFENYVTTNVFTPASGIVTNTLWRGYMENLFKYGNTEKLLLCGNGLLNVLETLANEGVAMHIVPGDTIVYGMRLIRLRSTFGDLLVRSHPLLSMQPTLTSWGFFIDMEFLRYRYMDDTAYIPDRQSPGEDLTKMEYLTECGLEFHFENAHAMIQGATSFAP